MTDELRAALAAESYLPAHRHGKGETTCVGCDLHRRLAALAGRFPLAASPSKSPLDAALELALRDWMSTTPDNQQAVDDLVDAAEPWLEVRAALAEAAVPGEPTT